MKTRNSLVAGGLLALIIGLLPVQANATPTRDFGGWDEISGPFNVSVAGPSGPFAPFGTVNHRGDAETAIINGTTHKRAKGWTTWVGKRHYTRARMESDSWLFNRGVVWTDSGRRWDMNGTSAVSPWSAFKPDVEGTPGKARTYYGAS